jgi:hypothetical protein
MRKLLLGLMTLATIAGLAFIATPAQAATEGETPRITKFNATDEFFPAVRDGYKDYVAFRGSAAEVTYWVDDEDGGYEEYSTQKWNITVRNSNGAKVAEKDGWDPEYGGVWWDWNGRTSAPARRSALAPTRPR